MVEVVSARRGQTRDKLVDAAVRVFAEKGVLGATVEEICEAAGFTRGAFYSNFDGKDALCLAILEHQADGYRAASRAAIDALSKKESLSTAASLDDLAKSAIEVFLWSQQGDRAAVLTAIELRLYAVRERSLRAGYLELFERMASEFVSLIEQATADFGLRLTVPGTQAVAVLQGVFDQSALADLLADRPEGSPGRAELLSGVLKSMLVPIDGD